MFKKVLAIALTCALCVATSGTAATAYANQTTTVTEQKTTTAEVTANIPSSFTVSIPKYIDVSSKVNTAYTTLAKINVRGSIGLNEVIIVKPESTAFKLKSEGGVELDTVLQMNNGIAVDGVSLARNPSGAAIAVFLTIVNPKVYPGEYKHDFVFDISVESTGMQVDMETVNNAYDPSVAYNVLKQVVNDNVLADVKMDGGLKYYLNNSFDYTTIDELEIPLGVCQIAECSLAKNVSSLVLPLTATSMERNCFKDFINITEVTVPKYLVFLNPYTFSGCTSLETVTLESAHGRLLDYCFENCTSLKTLILNGKIYNISENAFSGCTALETVIYDGQTYTDNESLIAAITANNGTVSGNIFPE